MTVLVNLLVKNIHILTQDIYKQTKRIYLAHNYTVNNANLQL